jgi:penicillin-binding protein 2
MSVHGWGSGTGRGGTSRGILGTRGGAMARAGALASGLGGGDGGARGRGGGGRRDGDAPRLRLSVLAVVAVALFAALFARLYDLQVVGTDRYQVQAEANRVRLVQVPAPRGRILDRNGQVIVDNRISVVVGVDRTEFSRLSRREGTELLSRLAWELNAIGKRTTVDQLRRRVNDQRYSSYAPVPVAQDVPDDFKIYVEEHAEDFPAVTVQRTTVRTYPYGRLASNVLGYVGKINETELAALEGEREKPYTLNDDIGKAGVELSYENHLRGTPGLRRIEVDANGDPVRVISERLPVGGSDLVLSIDIDIQALAQQRLEQGLSAARSQPPRAGNPPAEGTRGAVVVEDPNNGQILAMASFPTYDPTAFVDGIDAQEWAYLNDPANQYPLNNWAIQGQWAPGSTFKLMSGYAALHAGLMAPDTVFYDSGGYQIPGCSGARCYRRNAGGAAYGSITIREALTVSSDAYFYNVGAQFWLQRDRFGGEAGFQQHIAPWGIGQPTGIRLSHEVSGRLPDAQWRRDWCADVSCADPIWRAGDNVNLAVGQGDLVVTPLQLVNAYSTMANGGTRYQPQIALRVEPPGDDAEPIQINAVPAGQVDLPPEVRQPIYDGLAAVTTSGTASRAFAGFPHELFPVAGKTGTAQVDGQADTAVFAAFGPAPAPRYAVSVIMEASGFGGSHAAPVARALFDVFSGAVPAPEAPLGGNYSTQPGGAGAPIPVGGSYD